MATNNAGRSSAAQRDEKVVRLSSQDIHRPPPHSVEAEKGVLGSMLISPRAAIAEAVEKITAEYFYVPAHQTIFNVLVDLWGSDAGIDLITFTQILRDRNLLESVGGAAAITHLFTFVPTAANIDYYLGIVRDKFILRSIISAATESVRRAYEEQDEVESLLDEVEQKIFSLGEDRFKGEMPTIKQQVLATLASIEKVFENQGALTGIATGFKDLDRMTNGLHAGEMIVIAARPSMGKTAFAMNIAEYVAIQEKLPVAVFSLEMSTQQLMQRMLCSRARVQMSRARDGFLGQHDFPKLQRAASELADSSLLIDDTAGMDILQLRAKARRLKSQKDIQLIVVDYLQLLRSPSRRAQDNRQLEISEISAGLKGLAKQLNIPIIVVAQLNRNPETRTGSGKGVPRLADLRESGSIEQDADVVGLLVREDYYADTDEEREELKGKADLIIAKQRNGPVGDIKLTFLSEFTRFEDRAKDATEPEEAF
jgi:replicative DNA helicase